MTTNDIIELLRNWKTDFTKTKAFSQLPGIYAFFYIGDDFPILGSHVSKHQLIYIGKTESSQQKRDAETHPRERAVSKRRIGERIARAR